MVTARVIGNVPFEIVPYDDLDLTKAKGVETLMVPLKAAIRRVCPFPRLMDLAEVRAQQECEEIAHAEAMARVDSLIAERLAKR